MIVYKLLFIDILIDDGHILSIIYRYTAAMLVHNPTVTPHQQ